MGSDNQQPDESISNQKPAHVCVFEVKGTQALWAECACGEKLAGDNGPIVGSRAKVLAAIEETHAPD